MPKVKPKPLAKPKAKPRTVEPQWEQDARAAARKMGIPEAEMVREAKRALMAQLAQRIATEQCRQWAAEGPLANLREIQFGQEEVPPGAAEQA